MFSDGALRRASLAVLLHVLRGRALSSLLQRPTYTEDKLAAASFVFKGFFFFKMCEKCGVFFLFLVIFWWISALKVRDVSLFFLFLKYRKLPWLVGFALLMMDADVGLFFYIVDIELDVIGWAENLDGSVETRENQVGSAVTAYKCWNLKSSEKSSLQLRGNSTPMCKNQRSRYEISCFFSLSKQSLVEMLQSNLCLYALFRSSAESALDSSALFKISGCSVPADCPPLECDTCISNRLCSDNESRYLQDKNQTF